MAETFLSSSAKYTVGCRSTILWAVYDHWPSFMTLMTISLIPMVVFFIIMQRKIMGGRCPAVLKVRCQYDGTEFYRDPVFDGATDPMVIFNRDEHTWWMLYTSRRTTGRAPVGWVHGTDIGWPP